MKKMYLCLIVNLFVVLQCLGQQHTDSKKVLYFNTYNESGKLSSNESYTNSDLESLDLEKLVREHDGESRLTMYGGFIKDNISYRVSFDSAKETDGFCMLETMSYKPSLGIKGCSNEDFTGLKIETVSPNSPASQLGLDVGDILYAIDDLPTTTHCDYYLAMRESEVGQIVNVEFMKNDIIFNETVKIAGDPYVNVTFGSCENKNEELALSSTDLKFNTELKVYPNPTKQISHFNYTSDSKEPIEYFIMNSQGSIIFRDNIDNFSGTYVSEYNFNNQASGIYYFVVLQGEKSTKSKVLYLGL